MLLRAPFSINSCEALYKTEEGKYTRYKHTQGYTNIYGGGWWKNNEWIDWSLSTFFFSDLCKTDHISNHLKSQLRNPSLSSSKIRICLPSSRATTTPATTLSQIWCEESFDPAWIRTLLFQLYCSQNRLLQPSKVCKVRFNKFTY